MYYFSILSAIFTRSVDACFIHAAVAYHAMRNYESRDLLLRLPAHARHLSQKVPVLNMNFRVSLN